MQTDARRLLISDLDGLMDIPSTIVVLPRYPHHLTPPHPLQPTSYTLHPTPHPAPYTLDRTSYTLHPTPYTLLKPQPETRNPATQDLNLDSAH